MPTQSRVTRRHRYQSRGSVSSRLLYHVCSNGAVRAMSRSQPPLDTCSIGPARKGPKFTISLCFSDDVVVSWLVFLNVDALATRSSILF